MQFPTQQALVGMMRGDWTAAISAARAYEAVGYGSGDDRRSPLLPATTIDPHAPACSIIFPRTRMPVRLR